MRSGKIEFETLAEILLLTAFLIIVLLLFKGCMDSYNDLGGVGVKEYGCWATNVMKANVISIWPSTCRTIIVKDKVDTKTFGKLMGTCWWQYGKGEWDLGPKQEIYSFQDFLLFIGKSATEIDSVSTCYVLIPKEDIKVDELKTYMETRNVKGDKVTKPQDTMWNYLQNVAKGDNVCFDKNDNGMLKKGEIYYLKFLDDRGAFGLGKRDLLMITADKNFFEKSMMQEDFWLGLFGFNLCYNYGSGNQYSTGGTTFKTLDEFKEKANNCAKSDTNSTECYCSSIDLNQMPTNYKAFMAEQSEKSSSIQVIDNLIPGEMIPIKGALLQATCQGANSKCSKIIFDNTGMVSDGSVTRIGLPESIKACCQLQGTWHMVLKKENNTKKIILTQGTTPRENCETK
ncbi:MAG: hypothetical protein V1645_02220 [archaeon]